LKDEVVVNHQLAFLKTDDFDESKRQRVKAELNEPTGIKESAIKANAKLHAAPNFKWPQAYIKSFKWPQAFSICW